MNYKDCLICGDISIAQAMSIIEKVGTRTLFIVKDDDVLDGVLSDSDIRKWILKTGSIDGKAKDASNKRPKFIHEGQEEMAVELFENYHIDVIPVVDSDHRIVNVLFLYRTTPVPKKKIHVPVLMMAGGEGKRLYPYTKILPKPLIPIRDIPISQRIFDKFYDYGCRDFYMVVNYKKEMIKSYFGEIQTNYKIVFLDESKPLGTGGGICYAKDLITDSFILTNCDSILDVDYSEIVDHHLEQQNAITMICSMITYTIPYGIVEFEKGGEIRDLVEKPSYSFFTNTGIYIVDPVVFDLIQDEEVIDFPAVIERCKNANLNVGIYPIGAEAWMDMGQFDSMKDMEHRIAQNNMYITQEFK